MTDRLVSLRGGPGGLHVLGEGGGRSVMFLERSSCKTSCKEPFSSDAVPVHHVDTASQETQALGLWLRHCFRREMVLDPPFRKRSLLPRNLGVHVDYTKSRRGRASTDLVLGRVGSMR